MKQNETEGLQSRREFFKKAVKAALPVVGAVVLASIPFEKAHSECYSSCMGYCVGCSGSCKNTCHGSCQGGCYTTCYHSSSKY